MYRRRRDLTNGRPLRAHGRPGKAQGHPEPAPRTPAVTESRARWTRFTSVLSRGARRWWAELEAAGLTGRGGGGFPVARKLAAAAAAASTGRVPLVVANAAEGEPASSKDLLLLRDAPHLVLDGLQLVAAAIGADRAHLLVAPAAFAAVRTALPDRVGGRIDQVPVEITIAEDRFVAGEESAVVAAIEGRPALPGDKLRRVVESGVHSRPTVVQNVESLAHVALIARFGSAWFRSRGTAAEPGTALVTISGAVDHPGVREVAHGIPLRQVLEDAGVRHRAPVLAGGFHGPGSPRTRSRASCSPAPR